MSLADPAAGPSRAPADELRRLVDRLRTMPLSRLSAPGPDGSPADRAHALAQELADLATEHSGRAAPARVPRLSDTAVGDQVAVTGQDLLTAVAENPEGAAVVLDRARGRITELRRSL